MMPVGYNRSFPGFARDIDWKVFNAASPDQWWEDRDTLPPWGEMADLEYES